MPVRIAVLLFRFFGAVLIGIGLNSLREAGDLQHRFEADPVCTRALRLQTPPRSGTTCAIVAGTVDSTYANEGSGRYGSAEDHIVVKTSDPGTIDVRIYDDGGSYLADAKDGSPIVLETMDLEPALIATADGAVSSDADPHLRYEGTGIGIGAGAVMLLLSFLPRLRRRAARRAPAPGGSNGSLRP